MYVLEIFNFLTWQLNVWFYALGYLKICWLETWIHIHSRFILSHKNLILQAWSCLGIQIKVPCCLLTCFETRTNMYISLIFHFRTFFSYDWKVYFTVLCLFEPKHIWKPGCLPLFACHVYTACDTIWKLIHMHAALMCEIYVWQILIYLHYLNILRHFFLAWSYTMLCTV